jgi:tetratricopeptide (TPR) repeat protein
MIVSRPPSSKLWTGALIAMLLLSAPALAGQEADLAAARELYASAAYDDALIVLNRLRSSSLPAAQSRAVEQYRAFCLLALGRAADAEQAIEAVVAAEPSFQPTEGDVSPRVRSAFTDVRRRMLPAIVQQKYGLAKAAFDRKEFAAAAIAFSQVLVALADPAVATEASQPPLSDLRMLAVGFEELSAKAAAPPPPPPAPTPTPTPAPPPVVQPAVSEPAIYESDDRRVVPPIPVKQVLPPFPGAVGLARAGTLEIVINEAGLVQSAVMTESVTGHYDRLAIHATKSWRYRPATVNGVAVKFRKIVQINVK